MSGFSTELKVGAFALLVLGVLAFMTFKVGGLNLTGNRGYTVYVSFDNTDGLAEKSKVKIAGVDSGVVQGIGLVEGKAKVTLRIDPNIKIYRNATASIKSSGLMGEKFLELGQGTPDAGLLGNGGSIQNVTEVVDVDDLARNVMNVSKTFSKLAESLNDVIGSEEAKSSLGRTILNLKEISSGLSRSLNVNDAKFRRVLDNIDALTSSLNGLLEANREQFSKSMSNVSELSGSLKTQAPELIENLNKATDELKGMLEENRPAVKETVHSLSDIAGKMDRGEGSLGKLMKDDRLYDSLNKAVEGVNNTISAVDNFRTLITVQGEYLAKPKRGKGYFYLTLQPNPSKSLILGVVSDPVGTVSRSRTITTPGTTVDTEEIRKKIRFTAQFARRFRDADVRFGITENTLGLGADYYLFHDRMKIAADAWDFSNSEESASRPHVRTGVDYFLFKNLFLSAGVDNILNSKYGGAYMGGGLRFADEDWKHFFGGASGMVSK